ncbi:unnamed protein product [Schistocephalus solidus]|uniref:Sugar phosphate exchanger 3 n=1 Tax=Schistocephalus solidus TaxID=70667 RepID=A0A183SKJ9_SCHSO|nr:unnamed protein product [Schistocephalus solidus]
MQLSACGHRLVRSPLPLFLTVRVITRFPDTDNYNAIFGYLDLAYLLAYATGMFLSGHLAERMDLRVFLTIGCLLSGVTTALFGLGYFLDLHQLPFYLIAQTLAGFVQSSGWPAVVTCMGNWFGKGRRGLVLGLWNSHTSLGNILGGLLAGIFVESAWGWSFVVPGALIGLMGILVFFFLIPSPEDAGLQTSMSSEVKHTVDIVEIDGRTASMNYQTLVSSQQQSEENKTENEISGVKEAEDYEETSSETQTLIPSTSTTSRDHVVAISFCGALAVPGVVEYSLCLFFVKSVSYTFLFWLPAYIQSAGHFKAALSADLSTVFDIGGIIGGVLAGVITDLTSASAAVCSVMLTLAIPMGPVGSRLFSGPLTPVLSSQSASVGMLVPLGLLINGPYALITTAVSADLGTHPTLRGNAKALATVTAIIDGTGSLGKSFFQLVA